MDNAPASFTPDDGRSAERPPTWPARGNATPVSPHARQRGLLGVSPYGSPDDMRSTKRPHVHSLSPTVVVTPGVAVVHSPLPPLLPSPVRRPYTLVHPLSDFDALCFPVLSLPLQPRRLQFLSCVAQPFPPPPLFVGRDGLDSIPLEGCSQSSGAVFGSGGSTLRDGGRRSVEPRVSHSFAASGHGQGGVLDDARRASAGDTHDRNSARRSLVSWFDEDDNVCGSGDGPDRCDPGAQNLGAGRCEHSGGSLGQFGSQSTGSAKYSRLFLTAACKERLRLLQSAMKEVSDKSWVMSDVVDRLLHWSLPAIRDEGGDFVTLHNDVMMIADHWAGDHSRCVADRELLCSKADGPSRLPLYMHDDPVYDIIRQTLGRHCSTTVCSYYTEFRHTSTVETFQGTIIIYAKKTLHFEKSYELRLAIAVIRWNSHAWQDPLEYRVHRPSGTSIRPRPSHYRHNRPPTDSWMNRLSTFIFSSKCVSDWARRLLEYDDCDVSGSAP
ncbi:hypothetical protein CBR_g21044 [Chara braunii]|uniref:Uncharacterized protein n=1 Tax=Chara braunii TaxID=69332 RepID=A0A388L0L4_CHABU|nr:hypothetical protein CBR_g21044 [Chara braunii]|eukprot:GBG75798.1 hypothetical protein CBR_g21044 [Chara braunii]